MTTTTPHLHEEHTRAKLAADDADALLVDRAIWVLNESGRPWSYGRLRTLLPDVDPWLVGSRIGLAAARGDMVHVDYRFPEVWQGVE